MKKFAAILAAIMILAMLCGTIVPVSATEAAVEIDSSLYDAGAEGDLLYTLNFNGDDFWQPENLHLWDYDASITAPPIITVDPGNPNKCVFDAQSSDKTHWGGPVTGLPIAGPAGDGSDDYYAYTIIFKTVRDQLDEDGNVIDAKFGLYVDDPTLQSANGIYGYSYKMGLMNGSERIFKGDNRYTNGDINFINDGMTMQGINYREEGVDKTQISVQEYAIEVNAYEDTMKFYMKDSTEAWVLMQATESGDIMAFSGTYLCPTLYTWDGSGEYPITVEYVNIYKGMTLSNDELPVAPEVPADTTTSAQDTTAAPADTTTAAPADTTTNAPAGDNTTAAPTVTTKAPESNGCGGFAVLPVSIVAILGLAVTVVAKKAL